MGPNGSGKSTLASILAGKKEYEITKGEIKFLGKDLNELSIDERAKMGIFLSFQYPIEIPGISTINFLKTAINEIRKYKKIKELDSLEFMKLVENKKKIIYINEELINRSLNEGFSGGEKKKNEIFQMAMLAPKLSILDETDSGLDIDALKMISKGKNKIKNKENSMIIITHYQRILNYIKPDFVHILNNGKITKSGDRKLAIEVEKNGYNQYKN
jgi:Fe-S cluster assembly ATP-binding protein